MALESVRRALGREVGRWVLPSFVDRSIVLLMLVPVERGGHSDFRRWPAFGHRPKRCRL